MENSSIGMGNHNDLRLPSSILKFSVSRKPAVRNLGHSPRGGSPHGNSFPLGTCSRVAMVFLPALFIIFYQAGIMSRMDLDTMDDIVSKPTMAFGPLPLIQPEERATASNQSYMGLPAISTTSLQLPRYGRSITLVHVGKAGGITIRLATSLACRLAPKRYNTTQKMDSCLRHFSKRSSVLAHDVQYYLHMSAYQPAELHNSTSFLFLLRNPVERVISSFRYSHPQNCDNPLLYTSVTQPWGCRSKEHVKNQPSPSHQLYTVCFPAAGMEEFAQNLQSPFPQGNPSHHFVTTNMSWEQQQHCRWIARQFIQGQWEQRPGPHMKYNYEYYRNISISSHPNKEVFGVRTKKQWEDMKALDIAMGGRGIFQYEGQQETHGSENYKPAPLTTAAYRKLCCVLEREIAIFEDVLNHVINLNATVKQEMMDDVHHKCGLGTQSWDLWRRQCQERLEADILELEPFSMANFSRGKY